MYAQRQGRYVVGPLFSRRGGGVLRVRNLTFLVYALGRLEPPADVRSMVQQVEDRVAQSYPVVLREYDIRPGISLVAYRFQHTGDPVTQAAIIFVDRDARLYMIEITAHRKEETLLLGEARQIAHSIEK